jgi:hypothetical protein
VLLAREDAYKTAFNTSKGQLYYLRIGQGLTRAPRTFNRLKEFITGDVPSPKAEKVLERVDKDVGFTYFIDNDFVGAPTVAKLIDFLY